MKSNSGKRVSNAWVTYLEEKDSPLKDGVILHVTIDLLVYGQRRPMACYAVTLRGARVLSGCW